MNYTDTSIHVHKEVKGYASQVGGAVWATLHTGGDQVTFFPRPERRAVEELADAMLDAAKDLLAIAERLES